MIQPAMRQTHHEWHLTHLIEAVADRLADAARTLRRLHMTKLAPSRRMTMADVIFVSGDAQSGYGYVSIGGSRSAPSPQDIDQLDQVLKWIYSAPLSIPQRRLLWLRAEGRGWRSMAVVVGMDPSTCKRHYGRALEAFAGHLIERGMLI